MKDRIIQALLQSDHKDGDRLPSVRSIMKTYGVSSGTVQGALKNLAESSAICKIQGKGCFWGNVPALGAAPVIRLTVMENLANKFQRDLEQGFISLSKPLPQSKELSARYGVSQNTLRKFLNMKVESGLLIKSGRLYNFKHLDSGKKKKTFSQLIFVTRCNSWGGFTAESERELDFLRLVYKTAGKNNYKLILLGYNDKKTSLIDRSGKICSIKDFPNAVGIIISTLLVQNFRPLLDYFAATKLPVAVWWEHPETNVPKHFINRDNWVFFNSTFGSRSGLEMGQFLKSKGFTEVNYFSPYHSSSWSIDRLEGLSQSGIMVHSFVDDEYASPWDFKQLARKAVEKYSVEIYARNLEKEKLKRLIQQAYEGCYFSENIPWVCVNDEVAGLFLEIFDEGEISQISQKMNSENISFFAFDNSAESYLLQLSSYDFNTDALVEHIFYYFSNTEAFSGKKKIHHILGNVVEK